MEDEDETRDRISKVCRAVMTRLHAEISRSINFYRSQQGGGMPVKLYLTGGTALLPQVDRFFAENPFTAIGVGPKVDAAALEAEGACLAATAGTALHAAELAPFAINLLPPSLVKERADIAKIPFVAVGAVSLIAALVLVFLAAKHGEAVASAERDAVQAASQRLQGVEKKIKAAAEGEEREATKAESFRELFAQRGTVVAKINAVRSALGSEMWIEKWEGDRVTIRGWHDDVESLIARSKTGGSTAAQIIEARLKGSPFVDPSSVKIESMTTIGKDALLDQLVVVVKFGRGAKGEKK